MLDGLRPVQHRHMKTALILLSTVLLSAANMPALDVQIRSLSTPLAPAGIVGRSLCGGSAWLLSSQAELIQISTAAASAAVHQIHDLRPGDPFWGLACLDDESLWTLATSHLLVRLSADGGVVERRTLRLPHFELFAFRDRLLFVSVPIVSGRSVLAAGTRRDPEDVRPWAGMIGRNPSGTAPQLVSNLVGCGIAADEGIPCWFADQAAVSIGDGLASRTIALPSLVGRGIDQAAPVRDVALTGGGAMWVLAASSESPTGRRVGGRLIRTDAAGIEQSSVALPVPARLIVAADATSCVLLSTTGALMHVSAKGEGSR